jgi:hypothetical protein
VVRCIYRLHTASATIRFWTPRSNVRFPLLPVITAAPCRLERGLNPISFVSPLGLENRHLDHGILADSMLLKITKGRHRSSHGDAPSNKCYTYDSVYSDLMTFVMIADTGGCPHCPLWL